MFRAGAAERRAQQMDRRFMRAQALHLVKSGSQGFLPGSLRICCKEKNKIKQGLDEKDRLDKSRWRECRETLGSKWPVLFLFLNPRHAPPPQHDT